MLGFVLKVFVPSTLATRPDISTNSSDLDTLALVIGTCVVSLRTRDHARGVVKSVLGENEAESRVGRGENVDELVGSFVKWLSVSKAPSSRNDLLIKLRSRPDFAGQFVLG